MIKLFRLIPFLLFIALLSACGDTSKPQPAGRTMKTVIKATALTAGLNIGGVTMAINLPSGVKPEFNSDGSVNAGAALEFISLAPQANIARSVTYNSADSVLEFSVIDLAGFSTDDQIVVHLIVESGTPLETDFSIKSYKFFDKTTGASITGPIPTLTTNIH